LIREHILLKTFSSIHCNFWRYYESLIQGSFFRLMIIHFTSNLYDHLVNLLIATKYFSICFSPKTKPFQSDWKMNNNELKLKKIISEFLFLENENEFENK
jgi:hypothetical protein